VVFEPSKKNHIINNKQLSEKYRFSIDQYFMDIPKILALVNESKILKRDGQKIQRKTWDIAVKFTIVIKNKFNYGICRCRNEV